MQEVSWQCTSCFFLVSFNVNDNTKNHINFLPVCLKYCSTNFSEVKSANQGNNTLAKKIIWTSNVFVHITHVYVCANMLVLQCLMYLW